MICGIPPADAIVALFSGIKLKLHTAPAPDSRTRDDGDVSHLHADKRRSHQLDERRDACILSCACGCVQMRFSLTSRCQTTASVDSVPRVPMRLRLH
jgi:hypothetical protein